MSVSQIFLILSSSLASMLTRKTGVSFKSIIESFARCAIQSIVSMSTSPRTFTVQPKRSTCLAFPLCTRAWSRFQLLLPYQHQPSQHRVTLTQQSSFRESICPSSQATSLTGQIFEIFLSHW